MTARPPITDHRVAPAVLARTGEELRAARGLPALAGGADYSEIRITRPEHPESNAFRSVTARANWDGQASLDSYSRFVAEAAASAFPDRPATSVRLTFRDAESGNETHRQLRLTDTHGRVLTQEEIARHIDRCANGESLYGSDSIGAGSFVTDGAVEFTGAYRVEAGAGSTKKWENDYYSLTEMEARNADDCVYAVLRHAAVEGSPFWPAGAAKGATRGASVRRGAGMPESGPVAITDENLEKLAAYFGVGITAIAAEPMVVKAYHDATENRCTVRVEDVVIARGGASLPQQMRMAVASLPDGRGHALFVRCDKVPEFCPVTGDLLAKKAPKRTSEELAVRVLEQGRPWRGHSKYGARKYVDVVVVYDIETTWNPATGMLEPYLCGWYKFEPRLFAGGDFSAELAGVQIARGPRCVRDFVDFILALPNGAVTERACIVGFNSARFDNFLLAKELVNADVHNFDAFIAGNALRGVTVPIKGGGRHTSLDLCKLTPGRLADMCKNFETRPRKLEGFDHAEVQDARMAGRLDEWLNANGPAAYDYLRHDVLSTASLYVKGLAGLGQLLGVSPAGAPLVEIGKQKTSTIGSCAWEGFKRALADRGAHDACGAPQSEAADLFMRRCMTGGRVQCMVPETLHRKEKVAMVDVASLYPTACCAKNVELLDKLAPALRWGRFPLGAEVATDAYVEGKVGMYRVTVRRQPPVNVLPRRSGDAPLDWAYRGEFETHCTHVEIEEIRGRCGADAVDVHEGYYWEQDTHELFTPFFGPIIAEKNRQDALKKAKSPDYNPALREAAKLLVNSLTGKLAQRNYEEMCKVVQGYDRQVAAEKTFRPGTVSAIILGNKTVIMRGEKPADQVYNRRSAKPSYMSVFIYAYSRAYMYELLLSRYAGYYIDTDSYVMPWADYERFRADFPQLNPAGRAKELGDLERESEVGNTAVTECFFIRPKLYAMYDLAAPQPRDATAWLPIYEHGHLENAKFRGKGINLGDLILPADAGPDVDDAARLARCRELFRSPGALTTYGADSLTFFRRLLAEQRVTLLTGQLARRINAEVGFGLQQLYMRKTITLAATAADDDEAQPEADADDE